MTAHACYTIYPKLFDLPAVTAHLLRKTSCPCAFCQDRPFGRMQNVRTPLCNELLETYRLNFRMPGKTPLSILYNYAVRQDLLVSTSQSSCAQYHLHS